MQLSDGLFTLFGAVLGSGSAYLVGVRLADKKAKINARINAGVRLRAAFYPELVEMDPPRYAIHKVEDIEHFLRAAWPKHAIAVEEFANHLSAEKQSEFMQAWREYYLTNGGSMRFFDYYQVPKAEMTMESCLLKFKERVNAILRFTNE